MIFIDAPTNVTIHLFARKYANFYKPQIILKPMRIIINTDSDCEFALKDIANRVIEYENTIESRKPGVWNRKSNVLEYGWRGVEVFVSIYHTEKSIICNAWRM